MRTLKPRAESPVVRLDRLLPGPGFHFHVSKDGFEIDGKPATVADLKRAIEKAGAQAGFARIQVLSTASSGEYDVPPEVTALLHSPSIRLHWVTPIFKE
jgi:hypothetical protein